MASKKPSFLKMFYRNQTVKGQILGYPFFVQSDIAAFVLQYATFPHPTSSLLQISPCSPGSI